MLSVLNKWLFREMPNSRSCDEFSVSELQRIQIVLFTLRDLELNVSLQRHRRRMTRAARA